MKKLIIAALSMVLGFGAANAKAGGFKAPSLVQTQSEPWTGAYVGLSVATYDTEVDVSGFSFGTNDGYIGGVHLGYDKQMGRYVVGIRGEYNWVLEDSASYEVKNAWNIAARAGFLLGSRSLVYGLAGYGVIDNGDGVPSTEGFLYGVGFEHKLTDAMHFSIEAQRLAEKESNVFGPTDAEFDTTVIRGAISFKFTK